MTQLRRPAVAAGLLAFALMFGAVTAGVSPARAQEGALHPIKGEDGKPVLNYKVPVELESRIEELAGVVVVGNPKGDVTIAEFYDLNCPFCRRASADIAAMIEADRELRVVLVPFPVLGVASIQAARVELAVVKLATPAQVMAFHRKVYAGRGTIDGKRALAAAKDVGLPIAKVTAAADEDSITDTMLSHVRLGDALGLQATPSYIVKGVAVLGHPGRKALEGIVAAIRRCDAPSCDGK